MLAPLYILLNPNPNPNPLYSPQAPSILLLYINSLIVELKRNCCSVQCGSKEIPGLLFADDTALLGEDADGLIKALGILECWRQEWGAEVNSAKSGVMHFRGRGMSREKTVVTVHNQPIPYVSSYKYLECVIDEFLELKLMIDQRIEVARKALSCFLQRCRTSVGGVYSDTYKCLLESFIDLVLLYGAEVWGCMRGIDGVEQLQLQALRSFFGVCRPHLKASLWSGMDIMPIVWMARVRCIVFWFKLSMTEAFQGRVVRQVAREAIRHHAGCLD